MGVRLAHLRANTQSENLHTARRRDRAASGHRPGTAPAPQTAAGQPPAVARYVPALRATNGTAYDPERLAAALAGADPRPGQTRLCWTPHPSLMRLGPDRGGVTAVTGHADFRAHVQRLLALVLADAAAARVAGTAWLLPDQDGGLRLGVQADAPSEGGPPDCLRPGERTAAEVLAWLAEGVQEELMERDQVSCHVWPTCARHSLGAHPRALDARAVWWCTGAGGHALAPIGALGSDPVTG